jgi:hypothetical protein
MKFASVVFLLFLAGCQAHVQPVTQAVIKDPETTPTVAVIGDQLVTAWLTPDILANNPLWSNYGSAPGTPYESSAQVLARMPAALVNHPNVVVLLVGTFDTAQPSWDPPCNAATTGSYDTCQNEEAMIALAKTAGAKVLVCNLPATQDGPAGTPLLTLNPEIPGDESLFDRNLPLARGNGGWTEDGIVDLATAVDGTAWTSNGVTPNDSGAQSFTSAVQTVMAPLHAGYMR